MRLEERLVGGVEVASDCAFFHRRMLMKLEDHALDGKFCAFRPREILDPVRNHIAGKSIQLDKPEVIVVFQFAARFGDERGMEFAVG